MERLQLSPDRTTRGLIVVLGVVLVFMATVFSALASTPRTALVIGNAAYQTSPLKNPAHDAWDMAAKLRELGFDVTLLVDGDQRSMEEAVRRFGSKLRSAGGTGLFYYAGHGLQIAGRNYLVPVKADPQIEAEVAYECMDAGRILAWMEEAGNQLNILLLDACRNNPFTRSFRSASRGLARMDAPTGTFIAYATAPGSVAADGQGRNGVFTEHLLNNMARPGLDLGDVLLETRIAVAEATAGKQVPWETSSLMGRFFFVPGSGTVPPSQVASLQPRPQSKAIPTIAHHKTAVPDVLLALVGDWSIIGPWERYNGLPTKRKITIGIKQTPDGELQAHGHWRAWSPPEWRVMDIRSQGVTDNGLFVDFKIGSGTKRLVLTVKEDGTVTVVYKGKAGRITREDG